MNFGMKVAKPVRSIPSQAPARERLTKVRLDRRERVAVGRSARCLNASMPGGGGGRIGLV